MLVALNIFFTIAHLVLIAFNLFGWAWKKTRKAHLVVLLITAASWFILGIWYGRGYCPLTDWHWKVKQKLGEQQLPNSFVKYMVDKLFEPDWSPRLIDTITLLSLIGALVLSLFANFRRTKQQSSQ